MSCFYIAKPLDKEWNTNPGTPMWIIEGRPVKPTDVNSVWENRLDWHKTTEVMQNHIVVVKPSHFASELVKKSEWVRCSGPVKKFKPSDYIKIFHSLKPEFPLPRQKKIFGTKVSGYPE